MLPFVDLSNSTEQQLKPFMNAKTEVYFYLSSFSPLLGKYLKHLSLSPRVPQLSLQPFPPPHPSLPIIPSRGQEIPVPPPSSHLHFTRMEQAGTAPPAAGPRLSLRNPEVPSPQLTPNPLRLPRSRARGGPETPSEDPASSRCASGKRSGLNRPLPQSGKALWARPIRSAQTGTVWARIGTEPGCSALAKQCRLRFQH